MSKSVQFLIEQTKAVHVVFFERTTFGQGCALSVYLTVPEQDQRWLLRSCGPYELRLIDAPNVPLRLAEEGHPLRADLDEPLEALDMAPCPDRKTFGVLGALYVAHMTWAKGSPIPFGKFLHSPNTLVPLGGTLATGPRSFIYAMRSVLERFEVSSTTRVVWSKPDPKAPDATVLLFGEANYVRAVALSAEEVPLDDGD